MARCVFKWTRWSCPRSHADLAIKPSSMDGVTVPAGFGVHKGKQGLDSVCLRRGQAERWAGPGKPLSSAGLAKPQPRPAAKSPMSFGERALMVRPWSPPYGVELLAARATLPVMATSTSVDIKLKDRCMLSSSSMGRGEINRGISSIRVLIDDYTGPGIAWRNVAGRCQTDDPHFGGARGANASSAVFDDDAMCGLEPF